MQNKLAEAKKDIADGKDQRQKIRDKKLQGIQDQTAALKRDREEIAKITAEVSFYYFLSFFSDEIYSH